MRLALGKKTFHLWFNGKKAKEKDFEQAIRAFSDSEKKKTVGGFIFHFNGIMDEVHFGLLPAFWEGERCNHYDIPMKKKDTYCLIGTVPPSGPMAILAKSETFPIPEEGCQRYLSQFKLFSCFLHTIGYSGTVELDEITHYLLMDLGFTEKTPKKLTDFLD